MNRIKIISWNQKSQLVLFLIFHVRKDNTSIHKQQWSRLSFCWSNVQCPDESKQLNSNVVQRGNCLAWRSIYKIQIEHHNYSPYFQHSIWRRLQIAHKTTHTSFTPGQNKSTKYYQHNTHGLRQQTHNNGQKQ